MTTYNDHVIPSSTCQHGLPARKVLEGIWWAFYPGGNCSCPPDVMIDRWRLLSAEESAAHDAALLAQKAVPPTPAPEPAAPVVIEAVAPEPVQAAVADTPLLRTCVVCRTVIEPGHASFEVPTGRRHAVGSPACKGFPG